MSAQAGEQAFTARDLLGFASALLPGLHLISQIQTLASLSALLGMIGVFVNEYWIPLTREVWSQLALYLNLDLADPEKDVLTAAAFFLPMALLARSDAGQPLSNQRVVNILGLIILAAVTYLIGYQVVSDSIAPGWSPYSQLFCLMGLFLVEGVMITAFIIYVSKRLPKKRMTLNNREVLATDFEQASWLTILLTLAGTLTLIGLGIALMYAFGGLMFERSAEVGFIRGGLGLMVLVAILYTAFNTRLRFVQIGVWIVLLVALGHLYEQGSRLIEQAMG